MFRQILLSILLISPFYAGASSLQCSEVFKVTDKIIKVTKVKKEDLLHAALMLSTTANTNLLHPQLLQALIEFASKQKINGSLENAETRLKILEAIYKKFPDSEIVNQSLAVYLSQVKGLSSIESKNEDYDDFVNGWGFQLLSNHDPIYQDPQYLMDLMRSSHQSSLFGYSRSSRREYEVQAEFDDRWERVTKTPAPRFFTVTGSDVINHLISKYGGKEHVISFRGMWMASRGEGEMVSKELEPPVVSEPPRFLVLSKEEIGEIEAREAKIFELLTQRVKEKNKLNAIFLEPIIGAGRGLRDGGVQFFRREFLLKLQEFAKAHHIAIISDEILTGGGRTGKFFSYQHYEGFQPNIVVFGKGLQIAGFTDLKHESYEGRTTISSYVEPVIKANQLLKKIEDEDLLNHVNEVGNYFLQELRKRDPKARGVGVFLFSQRYGPAMGRFLPRLTITKEQIDEHFSREDSYRRY